MFSAVGVMESALSRAQSSGGRGPWRPGLSVTRGGPGGPPIALRAAGEAFMTGERGWLRIFKKIY